jgi:hypothetical protein
MPRLKGNAALCSAFAAIGGYLSLLSQLGVAGVVVGFQPTKSTLKFCASVIGLRRRGCKGHRIVNPAHRLQFKQGNRSSKGEGVLRFIGFGAI